MVKFSNISKLWDVFKPEEAIKDKKTETPPPPTQLNIPPVSQAKVINIKDAYTKHNDLVEEQPTQKIVEPVKSLQKPEGISFRDTNEQKSIPEEPEKVDFSKLEGQDTADLQDASALYDKLYSANQNILDIIKDKLPLSSIDVKEITQLIKETVSSLSKSHALLYLTGRESRENYLISHHINVMLFSLAIGYGLSYSQPRLQELGLAAFLHDIGMQSFLPLVNKEKKLSSSEYKLVCKHIGIGTQILQQIPEMPLFVIEVCYQHHGQVSDSGYKRDDINEYARIIGLADTFESLTHHRSYRLTTTTQIALRELTEKAVTDLDKKVIKILIKQIGIYPAGTFVLLNSQEVAEVIKINENFPLRPMVKIVCSSGDELVASKIIDLVANQSIYITATLTKEEALSKAAKDKL